MKGLLVMKMINYLKSEQSSGNGVYYEYICKKNSQNRRKNKKKDFKDSVKVYFIDNETKIQSRNCKL